MITNAYEATHDAITGLPNDFLFQDRLNRLIAISERNTNRFALLHVVVENYAAIVKQRGQQVGNQLILEIAERLKDCLREADTIGRINNNLFGVLLTQLKDRGVLSQLIQRVKKALAEPYASDLAYVDINISLAQATYPDNGVDAAMLMDFIETELHKS